MDEAVHKPTRRSSIGLVPVVLGMLVLWALFTVLSMRIGFAGVRDFGSLWRAFLAVFGLSEALEDGEQTILRLRLVRSLVAGLVGASLGLAGAYLQGLFRNGLASPSVVGVTAGSVLGASLALAALGGFAPGLATPSGGFAPLWITGMALVGALGASFFVLVFATRGGQLSVPTLLLAGVALNTLIAGFLAALQSFTLKNQDVARSILAWTFGTLDDRTDWQLWLVLGGLVAAAAAIPFVARELDLLAGGESDARALGVDVQRVKTIALVAAALATSCAVSVAGQIAFVGLVVPHLVRMIFGTSHRWTLPLSMLGGAVFLLACDWLGRSLFGEHTLRPGVVMSLIGGPFFLVLLVRRRKSLVGW